MSVLDHTGDVELDLFVSPVKLMGTFLPQREADLAGKFSTNDKQLI